MKTVFKILEVPKLPNKPSLKGPGRVRSKKLFPETVMDNTERKTEH